MLVAKKYYDYDYTRYIEEPVIKNRIENKPVAKEKSNIAFKIGSIFCIAAISASMILVILGYASISATKFNINALNKDINVLEVEIQELKAELDSLTRSDIIESKAINNLSMQYPKYEQIVFLNGTADNNLLATNDQSNNTLNTLKENNTMIDYLMLSMEKIYSLLD